MPKAMRAKKTPSNVTSIDAPLPALDAAENNLEEHIRVRAYEFFEQRGFEHGHDMEDWLRAEAELHEHSQKRTA